MAETDLHYHVITDSRSALELLYTDEPNVYVSGNLLLFYEPENKRKHIAPDIFVVKGVKQRQRDNYLVWAEGKGPDAAIEITSKSTRKEDTSKKFKIYRDKLKVREYFLFDPRGDYLRPKLQGFRLSRGEYVAITPVAGRLPSNVLGLHLEDNDVQLRFWDPKTGKWLPTLREQAQRDQAGQSRTESRLERELKELRAELDDLKRKIGS
jgi:Uma2 family endonuclease